MKGNTLLWLAGGALLAAYVIAAGGPKGSPDDNTTDGTIARFPGRTFQPAGVSEARAAQEARAANPFAFGRLAR